MTAKDILTAGGLDDDEDDIHISRLIADYVRGSGVRVATQQSAVRNSQLLFEIVE